jgi:hypothetical protein
MFKGFKPLRYNCILTSVYLVAYKRIRGELLTTVTAQSTDSNEEI